MKNFLIFLFLIPQILFAQNNWCGTADKMLADIPTTKEQNLMQKIRDNIENNSYIKSQDSLLIIPTVVHIVHFNGNGDITDLQVQDGMRVINEDFRRMFGTNGYNTHPDGADIEIEFAMALIDPQGNTLPEPGIERVNGGVTSWNEINELEDDLKPQTQWDPNQYFNIWTVNYGGNMSTNLGYAQFPSLSGLA